MQKQPRYAVCLEAIGDNAAFSALGMFGLPSRNWVAMIQGINSKNRWKRKFIKGVRDYSHSNSQGSRGIFVTYFLEEGYIYEISAPRSWRYTERYFALITNGKEVRMTKAEVIACLEKPT